MRTEKLSIKLSCLETFLYSHTSSNKFTVHCSFLKRQDLFSGNVEQARTAHETSWYGTTYSNSKKMWEKLMDNYFVSDASTESTFFLHFLITFYSYSTIFSKRNFISIFEINLYSVAYTDKTTM